MQQQKHFAVQFTGVFAPKASSVTNNTPGEQGEHSCSPSRVGQFSKNKKSIFSQEFWPISDRFWIWNFRNSIRTPLVLIRNHPKLGQGLTLEGWWLYLACPSGTSQWDKHNLSQWDRQIGTSYACPSGTSTACPNWDWERPLLVPWDKSYTHAGGLSLSWDKLYTHDGACPSSTCPNLSHKVGQQGRGKILWNEFCPFHEITGFTLTLLYIVLRSENSEENSEESRLFTTANLVLRPALRVDLNPSKKKFTRS